MLPVYEIQITTGNRPYHSGFVLVAAKNVEDALQHLAESKEVIELAAGWAKVQEKVSPKIVENLMWQGNVPQVVKSCIQYEDYWPQA